MKDRKLLTPAERLIVAADFKPDLAKFRGRLWVRDQVIKLASSLRGLGVCIKLNSILRAIGYDLIDRIHDAGLDVLVDLKLIDISETLSTDGALLSEAEPELLTVMCSAGLKGLEDLRAVLPETEVLGVTVLTSLKDENLSELGYPAQTSVNVVVRALAETAMKAGLGGVICSPKEAEMIRRVMEEQNKLETTINTPGIRPVWSVVKGDDQKRVMTPADAIKAGADRIVVGRPIVQAENPHDAVLRTIEEIVTALH